MKGVDRRRFLGEIGTGMLLSGLGPALARELDLAPLGWQDADDRLDFGDLEPLVRMMQETPADRIIGIAVGKLRSGTTLDTLIAAAALANARTFGGEDYTGYHCEMALMPARQMAGQMADSRLAALPVLKVIHRNATRIQERGGRDREVLRRVTAAPAGADAAALLSAERAGNVDAAEAAFAAIVARGAPSAYDALQDVVRENIDVHQVVLAWRAWDLLSVVGSGHAHTMLRQSLRHCVDRERGRIRDGSSAPAIRELLPRLMDEHRLAGGAAPESRPAGDQAVDALAHRIFIGSRADAARAVAEALASGIGSAAAGEAISLASVRLLLHDTGSKSDSPGKPRGSVHGASIGVHASDSASAWRHIAAVTPARTAAASLITAGWHTGGQSGAIDRERPVHAAARARVESVAAKDLPGAIEESIRSRDQAAAAALVERHQALGLKPAPLVELLLAQAVEHDGALHHEKFFRTAFEEFSAARPAFRWEYLAALARVVASGYGFEAPGIAEARERLLS